MRLKVGDTLDQSLEASGLLLLLAARLGDPLAHGVSKFLLDHPSREFVFPLEQIGYVQGMLDWLPRVPGRFAWTIAGDRHEIDLAPGGSYAMVLTKGQRASLAFERLEGELAVVSTWTATDAELPSDPTVTIKRTVTPAGNAPDDRLVRVRIEVTFGPAVTAGCYRITDLLPSGLAPLVSGRDWYSDENVAGSVDLSVRKRRPARLVVRVRLGSRQGLRVRGSRRLAGHVPVGAGSHPVGNCSVGRVIDP